MNVEIFSKEEFGSVRAIQNEGVSYVNLRDVMRVLSIGNITKLMKRLDNDGVVAVSDGNSNAEYYINESNFYLCVIRSDKPEAKRFQDWIVKDVIPSIRKTGMYMGTELAKKILDDPRLLSEIFMNFAKEKELLEKKIEEAKPKVEYFDDILNSKGRMIPTEVAKSFGLGPKDLLKLLISVGVLRRVRNHVDFTCKYENKGYGSVYNVECGTDFNGNPAFYKQFKFSEKGKSAIHKALKKAGVIVSPDDSKTVQVDKNKIKELIEKFDSKYEDDYFLN